MDERGTSMTDAGKVTIPIMNRHCVMIYYLTPVNTIRMWRY